MQPTILAVLLAVAHEPALDTSTAPTIDVKGKWHVIRAERDGRPWDWPRDAQMGHSFLILWRQGGGSPGFILAFDGRPFNGTLFGRRGPISIRNMLYRHNDPWMPGVYRFDGDLLTICWSKDERPHGDVVTTDLGQVLVVLKRK